MPFRSAKQRKFMRVKHPEIAKRWTEKYGAEIQPIAIETAREAARKKLKKLKNKA